MKNKLEEKAKAIRQMNRALATLNRIGGEEWGTIANHTTDHLVRAIRQAEHI